MLPLQIVSALGGAATSIVSPALGRAVAGLGNLPGALVLASYGRDQEREADEVGQAMVAAEGWDPDVLGSFMDTLSREQALHGDDPARQGFLDSHPSTPERSTTARRRAASLTRATPDPIAPDHAAFLAKLDGMVVGRSASEGVFEGQRFLHANRDFTLVFPEEWETLNTRAAVAGRDAAGRGLAVLQLAEGSDRSPQRRPSPMRARSACPRGPSGCAAGGSRRRGSRGPRAARSSSPGSPTGSICFASRPRPARPDAPSRTASAR